MKKITALVISSSLVLLSGCATITNGRFQQVTVQTQPPGADCVLSNDKGQWEVNSTPAAVQVHRSMNDLKVTCQKEGYIDGTDSVGSDVKKMMVGNVIFGGVLGAGIDTVNGAGFSYPNIINVKLQSSEHLTAAAAKKSDVTKKSTKTAKKHK